MFNDYKSPNRDTWKFAYRGSEILAHAEEKLAFFLAKEEKSRKTMSTLMLDANISPTDQRVSDCKRDIEQSASIREQCEVFVHEFSRTPDKEFHLSLSDVTFFNLFKPLEGSDE